MDRQWSEHDRPAPAPRRPSEPPPQHELLLRLQRSAGNAAVSRMMRARVLARADPTEAPPEPAPAPAAEVDPTSFAGLVETVKTKISELKTADATLKAATTTADKTAAKTARAQALAAH